MAKNCLICGCIIHNGGEYATPTIEGRSHATKHHFIAERFFGRSKNRGGDQRKKIFEVCPWNLETQTAEFCYDCHEEVLHNPVLLPEDIRKFGILVQLRRLGESTKTDSRKKLAGRIELLHDVLTIGIDSLLRKENRIVSRR